MPSMTCDLNVRATIEEPSTTHGNGSLCMLKWRCGYYDWAGGYRHAMCVDKDSVWYGMVESRAFAFERRSLRVGRRCSTLIHTTQSRALLSYFAGTSRLFARVGYGGFIELGPPKVQKPSR